MYQVTIYFTMNEEFMQHVSAHRLYINHLIEKGVIYYYSVSLESNRAWILIHADDKPAVEEYLKGSPLYQYWNYEIDELFVYDGQEFRLPVFQLN